MSLEQALYVLRIKRECIIRSFKCNKKCSECELNQPQEDLFNAITKSINLFENEIIIRGIKDGFIEK